MIVKSDNVNAVSIGEANIGTTVATTGLFATSTAYMSNLGLILNQVITYVITGTKTFLNDLILVSGLASGTTSIGTTNATTVSILPVSTGSTAQLILNGITSALQPSGTDTWSRPIVIKAPQDNPIPHTKILTGVNSTPTSGFLLTFVGGGFSTGCVPRIFVSVVNNVTSFNAGAYNVTNTSFIIKHTALSNANCAWVALGY